MVDMKFLSIPNIGTLTATTLTLSFSLLRSSTRTNIPNSFTGQGIRKNILASNHRCTKEQNHLEPTTTEQFKKHHTSTQTPSPQSDSRMEELSRSEDEDDTIKFHYRSVKGVSRLKILNAQFSKTVMNFIIFNLYVQTEKNLLISVSVLYIHFNW